jgi:poly(A) polymerase
VKTFRPPHAARGLALLSESGLLQEVLPEIAATSSCEQSPEYHPEGSVFNHLLLMLRQMPLDADPLLPWAVLLHDVGKPATASKDDTGIHFYSHERVGAEMAQAILERLRFPGKQVEDVVTAVRCHMQFKDASRMRKATLRRVVLRPTFLLEIELHRLDCLGSHGRLDAYDQFLREADELKALPEILPPLVRGDDVLALGLAPGPRVGALLEEAREKQLEGELGDREQALDWLRRRVRAGD